MVNVFNDNEGWVGYWIYIVFICMDKYIYKYGVYVGEVVILVFCKLRGI